MLYTELIISGETYKLRLNTRNVISLENQLKCNPLAIFGNGDTLPTVTTLVNILYFSLQQFHHGISLDKTYDLFDTWLAEGHNATEFIPIVLDIYKTSGLIKGETEKN